MTESAQDLEIVFKRSKGYDVKGETDKLLYGIKENEIGKFVTKIVNMIMILPLYREGMCGTAHDEIAEVEIVKRCSAVTFCVFRASIAIVSSVYKRRQKLRNWEIRKENDGEICNFKDCLLASQTERKY